MIFRWAQRMLQKHFRLRLAPFHFLFGQPTAANAAHHNK